MKVATYTGTALVPVTTEATNIRNGGCHSVQSIEMSNVWLFLASARIICRLNRRSSTLRLCNKR